MEKVTVRSGNLSADFENGFLRYIRCGGQEVLRMIYFALRDANWDTIPHQVKNVRTQIEEDAFQINYDCLCQTDRIDFRWKCSITGRGNAVVFSISGVSHSHFRRNRIGFCILHPATGHSGEVIITHPDGRTTKSNFPELVSPRQPFENISAMSWKVGRSQAHLAFEGEIFETEDQRNWLDASYKTYCTPLALPFPVEVKRGDKVSQKVTLNFRPHGNPIVREKEERNVIEVLNLDSVIPGIGLEANEETLTAPVIQRLKSLNLSHLRVEARMFEKNWESGFSKRLLQAEQIGVPVELVLFPDINSIENLNDLKDRISEKVKVRCILPIDTGHKSTLEPFLNRVLPELKALFPGIPVGGGTNNYFAELNRFRPPAEAIDFISFSANPQVHAFDDLSIIETIPIHFDVVESARKIFGNLPVHLSPITLRPRFNPDTTEAVPPEVEQLKRIDIRQRKALNALWTIGGFKHLAQAGARQVTYFQTVGEEGVLMPDRPSNHAFFPAKANEVFPVFEVLKILGEYKGGRIIHTKSRNPLAFEAMILEKGDARFVLPVNFSDRGKNLEIEGETFFVESQAWKMIKIK